jgi:phage terminase large subunit
VKRRYVDGTRRGTIKAKDKETGSTIEFIPATVYDNTVLMKNDPKYVKRLENLPPAERKAFLHGDWDIFEGQYFAEFSYNQHTCDPFPIPKHWRRYRSMDYGLDCFAMLWIATDDIGGVYVYRELAESNLIISDAAKKANDLTAEPIFDTLAPPDLWNRSQETGKSKAILFDEAGLSLNKSNNDRESGWLAIKELLRLDENGEPRLRIFRSCGRLISDLPQLQYDAKHPTDCSTEPHEITHVPDALRYFAIAWTHPAQLPEKEEQSCLPEPLRTDEDEYDSDEVIDW